MPQLVAIAVAGAALWAGYRWLARETRSMREAFAAAEEELRRCAEEAVVDPSGLRETDLAPAGNVDLTAIPKLELDAKSGEYRPAA